MFISPPPFIPCMLKKRGQLTIFMILGVIILFIFIFLLRLSQQVVVQELERGQETIFSRVFQKEGLRIFVEDCLHDELEQALIFIGEQGRLWNDQAGGTTAFVEGETGVMFEGKRVAYALTRFPYAAENAYPCLDETGSPAFCRYSFSLPSNPLLSSLFGRGQRWEKQISDDLEEYLKIEAKRCIDEYLQEHVQGAQVTTEDFTLIIGSEDDGIMESGILEDGIMVKAVYPLGFTVGEEDFFHLSVFDFVYPTDLKKVLRATMSIPLDLDSKYVDFDFTPGSMQADAFTYDTSVGVSTTIPKIENDYNRFGMSLGRVRVEEEGSAYGDTIYTFKVPFPHALNLPGDYTLRFARQNRPPALDYVQQNACPDGIPPYDVLVIKGNDEYGKLFLDLNALDPDEDGTGEEEVEYRFAELSDFGITLNTYLKNLDGTPGTFEGTGYIAQRLEMPKTNVDTELSPGQYTFVAKAKDKWGQEDSQEVRVLVDNSLDPDEAMVKIYLPWGESTVVSQEDPFYISVVLPTASPDAPSAATPSVQELIIGGSSITFPPSNCIEFPSNKEGDPCSLGGYGVADIQQGFSSFSPANPIYTSPASLQPAELSFSAQYCGIPPADPATGGPGSATTTKPFNLDVKACLPYKNLAHPYPYIPETEYYQKQFATTDGETDFSRPLTAQDINLYEANHSCCDSATDTPYEEGVVCFRDPTPGCFGASPRVSDGSSNSFKNKVLEQKIFTCDGSRGNICGKDTDYQPTELWGDDLICGGVGFPECYGIPPQCLGNQSWGYVDDDGDGQKDDGFCHGDMGCSQYNCDSGKYLLLDNSKWTSTSPSIHAKIMDPAWVRLFLASLSDARSNPQQIYDDSALLLSCGDCRGHDDDLCDENFDNHWGTCSGGTCNDD